ncbi:hypothetical protein EMPS_02226 [Entomortierella parvispora]|uniref:DUF7492 domain-containing protein n=1 Tax=Entomortierella parvispora TaxID=205924 RepID=A0A9P3LTI8_9FUNG|nr:hypothetical protein EMPS_02226 [Entomortierella parvispora]
MKAVHILALASVVVLSQESVLFSGVAAHSWLDCSNTISSTQCSGYGTGYPTRANPDINTLYTYLISGRQNNTPVCQPGRQDNFDVNQALPPASVKAGQTLTLTWEANGHLDDPQHQIVSGAAQAPSQVEIYWNGRPNTLLTDRGDTVGNGQMLLAKMNFATPANCEDPQNPNTVCHGEVKIPKGTLPGMYQLVWWWQFDKNPVGEEYSTCFLVNVD